MSSQHQRPSDTDYVTDRDNLSAELAELTSELGSPHTKALLRMGNPLRMTAPVWLAAVRTCAIHEIPVVIDAEVPEWLAEQMASTGAEVFICGDVEIDRTAEVVRDLGVDDIVVSSDPDSLTVRSLAVLRQAGMPRPAGVETLLDKAATREVADRVGVPVAPGLTWEPRGGAPRAAIQSLLAASERGVIVKGALGWAGLQQYRVREHEDFVRAAREIVAETGSRVIGEEVVSGMECSVELVRDERGTICVGWSLKGHTQDEKHPLHRPRIAPADRAPQHLVDLGQRVLDSLDYRGVADFDFVLCDDGGTVLLECNPRTSWATVLHWTSRGYSSVDAALSPHDLSGEQARTAAEFLLPDVIPDTLADAITSEDMWVHPGTDGYRSRGFARASNSGELAALGRRLAQAHGPDLCDHADLARMAENLEVASC